MSVSNPTPSGVPVKRFNVVISGVVRPGFDIELVRRSLAQLAHIDVKKAADLLNGQPRVVKSNVDQSTATQFQMKFEAIGVQCSVKPVGPSVAAPQQVVSETQPGPSDRPLTTQTIQGVFSGTIAPVIVTPRFRIAISIVAALTVLVPVLYVALIAALGYATAWHTLNNWDWLNKSPGFVSFLSYAGLSVAGLVSTLFLLKPLLAPSRQTGWPLKLTKHEDPLFFAFVEQIADRVGSPVPIEIRIDCSANASVNAQGGLIGLFGDRLVLTVGLPLIGGLNSRQLAGVIAREFGRFAHIPGMRFGYVVDVMNRWCARRTYDRDAWDDTLDGAAEQFQDVRGTLLSVAKGAAWLSRQSFGVTMRLGVFVNRLMSRRTAFNADQYEAQVAGSKAFESTTVRLHELNAAIEVVYKRLSYSWDDAKLPDNYPKMIVDESGKLPERHRDAIRDALDQQKPAFWSTRPTDRERIGRVLALNAPGVFQSDKPGTALLPRFERLCKQASLFHYRHVFGLSVTAEQLVGPTVAPPPVDHGEADEEHLKAYLSNLFSGTRYIPIKRQAAFAVPDLKETKNRIDAVIQQLRPLLPEYEAALTKFSDAYDRRVSASAARALAENKSPFDHQKLRVAGTAPQDADAALAAVATEISALETTLKRFESLMGHRMELAFSTRMDGDIQNSLNSLVQALTALTKTQDSIVQLRCFVMTASANASPAGAERDASLNRCATSSVGAYETVLQVLTGAPYPFAQGDGVQTLSDYVRKHCGPPDQLKLDLAQFERRVSNIWKCVEYLHYRVIARLCTIAAGAEEALGVTPLRSAKPGVTAETKADDAPDDKLPF